MTTVPSTAAPATAATQRDAFVAATTELLDRDERVALVLADISAERFADAARRHPDRVLNVGIREQLMVGVAAGLAAEGLRPIVHTYAPFVVERAYEQLKLDLGHQGLGAVVVSVGASYDAAGSGRTHHAPGDVAALDAQGGWRIVLPAHPADVGPALADGVARVDGGGRSYLRLSARSDRDPHAGPPGALSVARRGRGPTVLVIGPLLDRVLAAAAGLDVTVLHAATARPLDTATLRAELAEPVVAVVEPTLAGTSTRVVADALADDPHRVIGLGVGVDDLRRYGTPDDHDRAHGLDVDGLRRRFVALVGAD